jgi:hypothetical protein
MQMKQKGITLKGRQRFPVLPRLPQTRLQCFAANGTLKQTLATIFKIKTIKHNANFSTPNF